MAKKIFMTSLKGGTGVTTCCVGLGLALAGLGERTLIVDGDIYCACAMQIGGCRNMQVYTLADYSREACRAKQTLVSHPATGNLSFMPSIGLTDGNAALKAVDETDGLFDYILCDKIAPAACDCAFIVTDPYAPSVKSADFCRSQLFDGGMKDLGLIVNKLNGGQILSGSVMTAQEIASLLRMNLKAVIPEDLSLQTGNRKSETLRAFKLAAENVAGKRDGVCNVLKPYFGLNGYIKRKVRERL